MGLVDFVAFFLALVLTTIVSVTLANILGQKCKHYDGVLRLNVTDPDKSPYELLIDTNCDLDNVDYICIRVTRN